MRNKIKFIFIIIIFILLSSNTAVGKSDSITFKDKNLERELRKFYNVKGVFTKDLAIKLSKKYNSSVLLENANIKDLEGLQYFTNLANVYLSGNDLINLKPLSKLKKLISLHISDNSIKGKKFEKQLIDIGKLDNLSWLVLKNNGLDNIDFLEKITNVKSLTAINFKDNLISDITILKNYENLSLIALNNNRVSDLTPIKDLKNLKDYVDLYDNCIIDFSPIRYIIQDIFSDIDHETGAERLDFYENPVNIIYNGEQMNFKYLTVYYKYQPYAEAKPFFKAIGGSASYNKKTGVLTCKYKGKTFIFKDFSNIYTLNSTKKKLKYPMRRMQYDLAYIPIKDICTMLGLKYKVLEVRDDVYQRTPPKLIEISK